MISSDDEIDDQCVFFGAISEKSRVNKNCATTTTTTVPLLYIYERSTAIEEEEDTSCISLCTISKSVERAASCVSARDK